MTLAIRTIMRDLAPHFSDKPDADFDRFIGYAQLEQDFACYGNSSDYANALLALHLLTALTSNEGMPGQLIEEKVGDTLVKFSSVGGDQSSGLDQTSYGRKFKNLNSKYARGPIVAGIDEDELHNLVLK